MGELFRSYLFIKESYMTGYFTHRHILIVTFG